MAGFLLNPYYFQQALYTDPYYEYVSLLLNGDGAANGAQNNTFLDSSTNNFTITRNGNTTQGTFSPYGNLWSNYFDGSGDYLSLGTVASGGPLDLSTATFTLEAWVYLNSLTSADERDVIASSTATVVTNSNVDWVLRVTSGGYAALITCSGNNGLVVTSATQLTVGWNHIAATRTSNSATVYVNGVGTTGTVYATTNTNRVVQIGQLGNIYSFAGYISNARVVKGTAVYTSNFTPSTTPLTAVSGTSLLTCQSNRFIDNSSNNFTLTVNGNTSVQRFSPFNPTAAYSASTIGGSGYFDGTGDYLQVASNSSLPDGNKSYTIEVWVSTTDTAAMLLGWGATTTNNYNGVGIGNGTISNLWWANDLSGSAPSVNDGAWHFISCSYNGTTRSLYFDGIRVASDTPGTHTLSTTNNLTIGTWPAPYIGTGLFTGYMSGLRIVNSALYTGSTCPVPSSPAIPDVNTSLLLNFTNAGIPDAAMMNDLETVGNAQVSTSVKKYGTGSLYFDGVDDRLVGVYTPNTDIGSGDFTVECWVYVTNLSGNTYHTVYSKRLASPGYTLGVKSNGSLFAWNGTTEVNTSGITLANNTWYHVAWVSTLGLLKMFVNGTSYYSSSYTISTNTYAVAVGASAGNAGGAFADFFYGYIDDLRITKGLARYTANFTPPTAALPTY